MHATEPLRNGEAISIGLSGIGIRSANVRGRDGELYGCEFVRPLDAPELAVAIGGAITVEPMPLSADIRAALVDKPFAVAQTNRSEQAKLPLNARILLMIGSSVALSTVIIAGARALIA